MPVAAFERVHIDITPVCRGGGVETFGVVIVIEPLEEVVEFRLVIAPLGVGANETGGCFVDAAIKQAVHIGDVLCLDGWLFGNGQHLVICVAESEYFKCHFKCWIGERIDVFEGAHSIDTRHAVACDVDAVVDEMRHQFLVGVAQRFLFGVFGCKYPLSEFLYLVVLRYVVDVLLHSVAWLLMMTLS